MTVLHLLSRGDVGGIEILCRNYLNYSKNNNIVACLWGMGSIAEEMIADHHRVIDLQCSHFNIFKIVSKVIELCDSNNIQAIIAHHSIAALHFCLLKIKKKRPEIKLYFYAQSNATRICKAEHKILEPIQYRIIKAFYKEANEVIAISKNVQESLKDVFGERLSDPIIIYNGVPIDSFDKHFVDTKKIPTIIYVGRLIEEKGVQIILTALSHIECKYRFVIVGDGPYKNKLEQLSQELNISEKIEFLGFRRDISNLLSEADYFIHMPICQEGFGLSMVEAMAAGLVCIGSSSGAIPEIICNKKSGYIVEPNSDSLEQCLKIVLKQYGSKSEEIIRQNAIECAKKFSFDIYVEKMDRLLNGLL